MCGVCGERECVCLYVCLPVSVSVCVSENDICLCVLLKMTSVCLCVCPSLFRSLFNLVLSNYKILLYIIFMLSVSSPHHFFDLFHWNQILVIFSVFFFILFFLLFLFFFILFFTFFLLQVLRRAVWNIFRIEWEVIVQEDRALANKDGEMEKMIEK